MNDIWNEAFLFLSASVVGLATTPNVGVSYGTWPNKLTYNLLQKKHRPGDSKTLLKKIISLP
jgi:hypothetical protein